MEAVSHRLCSKTPPLSAIDANPVATSFVFPELSAAKHFSPRSRKTTSCEFTQAGALEDIVCERRFRENRKLRSSSRGAIDQIGRNAMSIQPETSRWMPANPDLSSFRFYLSRLFGPYREWLTTRVPCLGVGDM
jgi:hypothetical protein